MQHRLIGLETGNKQDRTNEVTIGNIVCIYSGKMVSHYALARSSPLFSDLHSIFFTLIESWH